MHDKYLKKFEEGERSVYNDIAPAVDRVGSYRRKCFGKLYRKQLEGMSERPISEGMAQSSTGYADVTTQADSVIDLEEKGLYQHPFKTFYTSGEPVQFKT